MISRKLFTIRPQKLKLLMRNHTTAFSWYDCRWPWQYFKVIRLCNIKFLVNSALYGQKLLQTTNRKSYTSFRMVSHLMTLKDVSVTHHISAIFGRLLRRVIPKLLVKSHLLIAETAISELPVKISDNSSTIRFEMKKKHYSHSTNCDECVAFAFSEPEFITRRILCWTWKWWLTRTNNSSRVRTILALGYWVLPNIFQYWVVLGIGQYFYWL